MKIRLKKRQMEAEKTTEEKRRDKETAIPEEKPPQAKQKADFLRDLLFLITKVCFVCLFFWGIFTFLFGITRVKDMDMTSSVREGDIVVYNRLEKDYLWWECAVVEYGGELQVRRVVATAGDTVDVTEEGLKVNGYLQSERYITEQTRRYAEGIDFPVSLGEGQIFVLGDARYDATDSRIYGPVDEKDTLGKVMLVIRRRDF